MAIIEIRWTNRALRQLSDAYDYLQERSEQGRLAVKHRVVIALTALESYPEIGREGRVIGTYELFVTGTPFILVYRLKRNRIEVIAFLHSSRKWPSAT